MAPTRTIKNKFAASKSGSNKSSKDGGGGITKSKGRSGSKSKAPVTATQVKGRPNLAGLDKSKKKKQRVYTERELGIPELNMVTPVGVTKPRGKKKGKVFVDDRESMTTILALVQAEKDGQIESKMIKARQMEEIREARRAEAEKKEAERKARLEDTKESLRKKRKRSGKKGGEEEAEEDKSLKVVTAMGTKAAKPKKKRVSFAAPE
ncbi:60S ribosomal subunit assembly/export protein [Madurella fahalii]|uniref:60S ribosomal subunit assembly/export protein n=1 Tax=Madurella fahalii TaxID=1157608 RepID=A0ABQ0G8I8_9PEZI